MRERDEEPTKTLTDEDIEEVKQPLGRRKALSFAGVSAAGAVALATGCGRRRIIRVQTGGVTDADGGPCADPAGGGRGNSGITDSDGGACADPGGRGRGGGGGYRGGGTGITDSDGGPCADPAGGGRGYSGRTDSDGGACADPAGRGRY